MFEKTKKRFDLDLNVAITRCPHWVPKFPYVFYCRKRNAFVKLKECKVCVVGRSSG